MGNRNSAANATQAQEKQQTNDENSPSSDTSGVYLNQNFQGAHLFSVDGIDMM